MPGRLRLPPLVITLLLSYLIIVQLAIGTSVHFVVMMAIAVLSACLTYNLLGGLGTISGIGFTGFALGTLIVSQVGKAVVLERADQNLDVPQLTITVYAVYYLALLFGTFLFSRIRLPLPRAVEPLTGLQSRRLYFVSLVGGLAGVIGLFLLGFQGQIGATSLAHGVFLVLVNLLPFSLVLAVDQRIHSSAEQRIFGWMAFWPTLAMELQGFLGASRQGFVEPIGIIFLTCYLRGFRFRRKHVLTAIGLSAMFFVFVSPYYLYSRAWRETGLTVAQRASAMWNTLVQSRSQWDTIRHNVGELALEDTRAVNYFDSPGAVTLNRFALIGPDSTLIRACSTGFHYGFTSLRLDFLSEVPRVLDRNKPEFGSGTYLGQLDGLELGAQTTTFSTITPISDSYGSFGWLGVTLFPFIVLPAIFVVYESIFDPSKPWGTVATVLLVFGIAARSMGAYITEALIKTPFYILMLSYIASWGARLLAAKVDRNVARNVEKVGAVVIGDL